MPDCENCNEKCPQAEMANEIALGRMYATQELVRLVKQLESGQLVEVVRCKDCIWFMHDSLCPLELSGFTKGGKSIPLEDDYCSYGERKTE